MRPCPPTVSPKLMPQLRLHDGLSNFGAAVGAFIGEVDLRHAPMRLDVAHIHRKSDTARTDDKGRFDIVMMDIGWHVGSPQEDTQESIHQWSLTRSAAYASGAPAIMNSREHRQNVPTIPACVANLHDCSRAARMCQSSSRDSGLPSTRFNQARALTTHPTGRRSATIVTDLAAAHGLALKLLLEGTFRRRVQSRYRQRIFSARNPRGDRDRNRPRSPARRQAAQAIRPIWSPIHPPRARH
jgi:hypothetical protein